MSKEQREAYVTEHLEISKRVQEANAPKANDVQNTLPQNTLPQTDIPFENVQPLM
jgi:hypothetical protein